MPVAKPGVATKSTKNTKSAKTTTAAAPAPRQASKTATPPKPAVKTAVKSAVNAAVKQVAAKAPAKSLAKSPAKSPEMAPATKSPARKAPATKVIKPTAAPAAVAKPPKIKLVRDSFTIPRTEYDALDALKERLVKLTHPAKKSEVLRAGIAVLTTLNDTALLAALDAVPAIKTGRPKKAK